MTLALVLGGADCLQDDLDQTFGLVELEECVVIAVNDAGVFWPHRLDHWVTMHPTELPHRIAQREERGYPGGFTTWTRPYPIGLKERERMCDRVLGGWNGSSGLVATGVALQELGLHTVLCGMPMDQRPHFNREGAWEAAPTYRERWVELHDQMAPVVRSWSGWTRERFGAPTAEWLDAARRVRLPSV